MTESAMTLLAASGIVEVLEKVWAYAQIFIGFSLIIFFHELGHFMVAKWAGVRVEKFAVGFFREVFGFTYGETRYSFNLLPLGGYVKMLGQEDFEVDTTGELQHSDDPRSFVNKPVGHRMAIVSAGVVMNLILAGLLFMIVFMVGMEVRESRVGTILPDSPAAMAGIMPGDIVRSIDGEEINDFNEIAMAVVLAEPGKPLDFEVERQGKIMHFMVEPRYEPKVDTFQAGIGPAHSREILVAGPEYSPRNARHPRRYDKIVSIDGVPVTQDNADEMINRLLTDPLNVNEILVERSENPDDPDSPTRMVPVNLVPRLVLDTPEADNGSPRQLLGLVPLVRVSTIEPGGRADLAGLEQGDVILSWDGKANPTRQMILKSVAALRHRGERDIPVRVRRDRTGKIEELFVRPKIKVHPITRKPSHPEVGATFLMFADDILQIARVDDKVHGKPTPAAAAGLQADAVITHVNGKPVKRWIDLAEAFRTAAGGDVELRYTAPDGEDKTTVMHIPPSIRTELELGPRSVIVSVAGKEEVEVTENGQPVKRSVSYKSGLRKVLSENVGKTVEVGFRRSPSEEIETAKVTVSEDMIHPWLGMLGYTVDIVPGYDTKLLRKPNPLAALKIGVKKTYYFVMQVYVTMERMIFSRSLSVDKLSGPVGILKLGGRVAEAGWVQLVFFMAMISANLAVINFLPLPIVDGGHMVFLLIEKIKGSPVSIRVQVATQVIGIVLLATAFLFVTIQDFAR